MKSLRWIAVLVCAIVWSCQVLQAKEEMRKCGMGRDYWIYTPDNLDAAKTYWLVVGVHGAKGNGKGAAGLAGWVNQMDNVIVIGPSFPSSGPFYQGLGGDSDRQLLDIQKALQKEFKLYGRMFLYGFSGGAQYCHRFANKHPESVIGVSANSGGSWDPITTPAARKLLWTVSCGLKDTALSTPDAKFSRIEFFRSFYAAMNQAKGFTCKPFVTDQGHRASPEVSANTVECFRAASTGMFDYQREATKGMSAIQREAWILKDSQLVDKTFDDGVNKIPLKVNKDGWTVGLDALKAMAETRKATGIR